MLLRTIVQKSLRGHVFLFLLGMYLGTALWVRMLTLFLTFWGNGQTVIQIRGIIFKSHQHGMRIPTYHVLTKTHFLFDSS